MLSADETHIELRHRLDASPNLVFTAFSQPDLVERWLRPSPDVSLKVIAFDFREGGAYQLAYGLPDGSTVTIGGKYHSVQPPSRIVFSWVIEPPDEHAGIDSLVTITITPEGSGSLLTIRHERLSLPGAVPRHAEGWRGAIRHLSALLQTSRD